MTKFRTNIIRWSLLTSDVLALVCAFFVGGKIGYYINVYFNNSTYHILFNPDVFLERGLIFGVLCVAVIGWIISAAGYDNEQDGWDYFGACLKAITFAFVIDVVIQYATKQSFSRLWLMGSWASAIFLLPLFYWFTKLGLKKVGLWRRKVVVFRSNIVPYSLSALLASEWPSRYESIGEYNIDFKKVEDNPAFIKKYVSEHADERALCFFSCMPSELNFVEHMCRALEKNGTDFYIIPDLGDPARRGLFQGMSLRNGIPFIHGTSRLLNRSSQRIKRVLDIVLSLLMLIFIAPLMLALVILIKRDGGPSIYGHTRIGYKGHEFKCLKFRSMHINSDEMLKELLDNNLEAKSEWERDFKIKNDPRVTKIGHFIRKTSLDELPQLFNVLRGEMSLVGPRPIVLEELENYYGKEGDLYTSVIPGITGLWQVSGRNNTTYEKRIDLDARYARTWSVFLDLKILLVTPLAVFLRKGAY